MRLSVWGRRRVESCLGSSLGRGAKALLHQAYFCPLNLSFDIGIYRSRYPLEDGVEDDRITTILLYPFYKFPVLDMDWDLADLLNGFGVIVRHCFKKNPPLLR